jgi:hypothetical protein
MPITPDWCREKSLCCNASLHGEQEGRFFNAYYDGYC